jgi:hypothetical protein
MNQLNLFEGTEQQVTVNTIQKPTNNLVSASIKAKFPHPELNHNLKWKGLRTWEQWQELSKCIVVADMETEETFNAFPHPYDPKYYIIEDSWKENKAIAHIILKVKCEKL